MMFQNCLSEEEIVFFIFTSRTMEATGTGERWFDTYQLGGGIRKEQCTYIMYCNWPLRPD